VLADLGTTRAARGARWNCARAAAAAHEDAHYCFAIDKFAVDPATVDKILVVPPEFDGRLVDQQEPPLRDGQAERG
jgi:hypothetical protein